ncbi:hypothetical protein CBS76997_3594 [Aspergillus niger]|nr:hypothetical protein CBS13152_3037 [Aspergillus niger]KAI3030707.1 hypothetical protein CBS147347_2730 [Aspergillus niger]KAI3047491.1 hypothetical protein CBS76997_3594 [Aspergillus niger]
MTVGEPARAQDRDAALASMDNDPKPLSVIVIGAGIAGLTAAAALRKAGPHCSGLRAVKIRKRVGSSHICELAMKVVSAFLILIF